MNDLEELLYEEWLSALDVFMTCSKCGDTVRYSSKDIYWHAENHVKSENNLKIVKLENRRHKVMCLKHTKWLKVEFGGGG